MSEELVEVPVKESQSPYLTTAYTELCRSYQNLHEFRMKLLGLLPIASVVGLLALGKVLPPEAVHPEAGARRAAAGPHDPVMRGPDRLNPSTTSPAKPDAPPDTVRAEVVAYIGIFSGLFTLALFGYEVRSLLMCHDFYVTGAALESRMGLEGQFTYCNEKRPFACYAGSTKRPLARAVNDKVTSCLIYSLVFASWFYVGLRFAFDFHPGQCIFWASGGGIALTVISATFLHRLTREPAGV